MARPQPKRDFTIQRDKYFTNDIIPYPYSDTDFLPNSLNAPPSQTLPSSIPAPSNRLLLRVPPLPALRQRPRRNRLPTNGFQKRDGKCIQDIPTTIENRLVLSSLSP